MKQKETKSTLLADNTQGLITKKQTKPRLVASAAPQGGGGEIGKVTQQKSPNQLSWKWMTWQKNNHLRWVGENGDNIYDTHESKKNNIRWGDYTGNQVIWSLIWPMKEIYHIIMIFDLYHPPR